MQMFRSRIAVSLAALATFSVTATPVLAHGPGPGPGDWHRHRHYRGGGIDGGDLLAGLLVIGGVAAIASAASKSSSAKDEDTAPPPYSYPDSQDSRYGDAPEPVPGAADNGGAAYPGGPVTDEPAGAGSFGGAVDACSAELERGERRVESVDSVRRMGERYSVEGRLADGRPYACSVDDAGHIRSVAVDGHGMI